MIRRYETISDAENGTELFADVSLGGIYTSAGESGHVENSLILQLCNTTTHDLTLCNAAGRTDYPFLPIESAVPVDGLTMIYFTFSLGDREGCLTSASHFQETRCCCPPPFAFARAGENSLVLFPTATVSFSAFDIAELRLDGLVTELAAGGCSICRVTLFCPDRRIDLHPFPICLLRHPLQIACFEADAKYYPAGFGDRIQFHYRALGADSCTFIPGDIAIDAAGNGVITADLYCKTVFTLTASRGAEQTSSIVELAPMTASIEAFTAKAASPPHDGKWEVTFSIRVFNTHHVYLSRLGRVELAGGGEQTLTFTFDCSVTRFTLSVENTDGLVQRTCKVEPYSP